MNIAVVHWLVNDVGGINSWTENFLIGLKRLGHSCQLYYGSHQRSLACDKDVKVPRSRRYHLLPAIHLSYAPQFLKESIQALDKYDLIVFAHPSPHPTKSSMSCSTPRAWQEFYTETTPFKISVFHDRHWDRTNAWIEEVRESVGYAHAAQHHFINSLKKFAKKDIPHGWGMFPLLIPSTPPSQSKKKEWILATQWLALKNHRYLIPNLLKLKLPLSSYGSGQTYHKLLPEIMAVYREDHHQDVVEHHNKNSPHVHYGHRGYRRVLSAMRSVWFSLDLSTQGMTNMTHWEPMTVGTISVMSRETKNDKYCEIPNNCCLTFSLDTLVEDMNCIGALPTSYLQEIQSRAWEFVQKCDCTTIAKSILKSSGVI